MGDIRKPAVASMFYPDDKINLKRMINNYLTNVPVSNLNFFKKNSIDNLLGIIVPHAGYVYSGQVAAYGYSLIKNKTYDTVILIGPSHFTYFEGFSLPNYEAFETPLGNIEVDGDLAERLEAKGKGTFDFMNSAHVKEHSLEVQLPFLQTALEESFKILPILMGSQNLSSVEKGADILFDVLKNYDKNTLIVISSDLSHYHSDQDAREMDNHLIELLDNMSAEDLMKESEATAVEACGAGPIGVLLKLAAKMNRKHIKTLVYKNSGEVSGDRDRVVGYLSAAVW